VAVLSSRSWALTSALPRKFGPARVASSAKFGSLNSKSAWCLPAISAVASAVARSENKRCEAREIERPRGVIQPHRRVDFHRRILQQLRLRSRNPQAADGRVQRSRPGVGGKFAMERGQLDTPGSRN